MPEYLKQRHNNWSVRVKVPKALRPRLGVEEFVKSLGTSDLKQANRLKWPVVAEFKRKIDACAKGTDEHAKLFATAADLQTTLLKLRGQVDVAPSGDAIPRDQLGELRWLI